MGPEVSVEAYFDSAEPDIRVDDGERIPGFKVEKSALVKMLAPYIEGPQIIRRFDEDIEGLCEVLEENGHRFGSSYLKHIGELVHTSRDRLLSVNETLNLQQRMQTLKKGNLLMGEIDEDKAILLHRVTTAAEHLVSPHSKFATNLLRLNSISVPNSRMQFIKLLGLTSLTVFAGLYLSGCSPFSIELPSTPTTQKEDEVPVEMPELKEIANMADSLCKKTGTQRSQYSEMSHLLNHVVNATDEFSMPFFRYWDTLSQSLPVDQSTYKRTVLQGLRDVQFPVVRGDFGREYPLQQIITDSLISSLPILQFGKVPEVKT